MQFKCKHIKMVRFTGMQIDNTQKQPILVLCTDYFKDKELRNGSSTLSIIISNWTEKLSTLFIPEEDLINAGFSFLKR